VRHRSRQATLRITSLLGWTVLGHSVFDRSVLDERVWDKNIWGKDVDFISTFFRKAFSLQLFDHHTEPRSKRLPRTAC
jgi:hypothetical protein